MARKTKQQAQETRQHILDVALRMFSQQGVSSTSLAEIAKAAGVTRGAIYWHFKNKSDLFSEIWELAKPNIDELETEYQAKFPDDPLSVLREILIYVLETTVTEERRRLLLEIIFHKCEFVGEMASVQLAQRHLCIENYDRIEQTLRHCMDANMLPENLNTRRVAVLLRLMAKRRFPITSVRSMPAILVFSFASANFTVTEPSLRQIPRRLSMHSSGRLMPAVTQARPSSAIRPAPKRMAVG